MKEVFMRAKMVVTNVDRFQGGDNIKLSAVSKSSQYPVDGSDEDNTYAKFSPSGKIELTIANPNLIGKIEPGSKFYIDFVKATE